MDRVESLNQIHQSRFELSPSEEVFYHVQKYIEQCDATLATVNESRPAEKCEPNNSAFLEILTASLILGKASNAAMAIALIQDSNDFDEETKNVFRSEIIGMLGFDIIVLKFDRFAFTSEIPDPKIVYGLNALRYKLNAELKAESVDTDSSANELQLRKAKHMRRNPHLGGKEHEISKLVYDLKILEFLHQAEKVQAISNIKRHSKSIYNLMDPYIIYSFAMQTMFEQAQIGRHMDDFVEIAYLKHRLRYIFE